MDESFQYIVRFLTKNQLTGLTSSAIYLSEAWPYAILSNSFAAPTATSATTPKCSWVIPWTGPGTSRWR